MKRTILFLLIVFSLLPLNAQDYGKMSAYLRKLAHERVHDVETRGVSAEKSRLKRVMLVKGEEENLSPYCLTHQGDLHLCYLTVDEAISLSLQPGISRIQASQSETSATLDTLTKITSVNRIWKGENLPQAYTGKGVLIGSLDGGIEYDNPVFRDETDGHLRIVRVWDKLDLSDYSGYDSLSHFPIGKFLSTPEDILAKGHSVDSELLTHGTMTISVAAGVAAGTPYRGVAYDADIYSVTEFLSGNKTLVDVLLHSYYDTDEFMLLSYSNIFAYADSVGQPCVINVSLGSTQDMTDCDIMTNEYIKRLLKPGHIIVASAGNDGKESHYMEKPVGKEAVHAQLSSANSAFTINISTTGPLTLRFINDVTASDPIYHDIALDMVVGDTLSQTGLKWYGFTDTQTMSDIRDISFSIYSGYDGFDSTRVGYDIFLDCPEERLSKNSHVGLMVLGKDADARVFVQKATLDNYKDNDGSSGDVPAGLGTVLSPGCLPSVITAGSTSHRIDWMRYDGKRQLYSMPIPMADRANFSSCGPSFHGHVKPDVMAPGVSVVSALNSVYFEHNEDYINNRVTYKYAPDGVKEYQWAVDCGTSLSAPVVSGIIALWLQADPTLTTERVKEIFAKTCRQDDSMLNQSFNTPKPVSWPNNECGYGEINAYRGLLEVLGIPESIPSVSLDQLRDVRVVAESAGQLSLIFPQTQSKAVNCRVYSVSGELLTFGSLQRGEQKITLSLPTYQGVVVVQVEGMGSTLIRL